eukprot:scaffold2357_cov108-Cylindrotheca_fusiformis.AAC.4
MVGLVEQADAVVLQEKNEKNQLSSSLLSYETSKFDHVFSGISVWLELETTSSKTTTTMSATMKYLQDQCGGEKMGVSSFVPHVTLLYNLETCPDDPNALLTECWKQFIVSSNEEGTTTTTSSSPSLKALNWKCFRYPKIADDGKGFGCSIPYLEIETSPWLNRLYQTCQVYFGQGERKGGFFPHLSMAYAPEDKHDFLMDYVNHQQQQHQHQQTARTLLTKPLPIKYLSVWSTQGRINEWYPMARIPIDKTNNTTEAGARTEHVVLQRPTGSTTTTETCRGRINILTKE